MEAVKDQSWTFRDRGGKERCDKRVAVKVNKGRWRLLCVVKLNLLDLNAVVRRSVWG